MKIYIGDNSITLAGKAWEIRNKLKEYARMYPYIQAWIQDEKASGR